MIDIGKIIKRAWYILWDYKILWIFGILLALTAGGSGGGSNAGYRYSGSGNNNPPYNYNPDYQPGPVMVESTDWFNQNVAPLFEHPGQHVATLVWIGLALVLFILICAAVNAIIRYPSETAVLRMVDEYEQTGAKVGFKQGWRLGWTRRAFRLWLLDLIISLPILTVVLVILGLGIGIAVNAINGFGSGVVVMIVVVGFAFLLLFLFAIAMVFVKLLRQFFARKIALEDVGLRDSFRLGWQMFKRNWKSAGLMWLVMLGVGIGMGIAGAILLIVLIPAYIILAIPGAVVAAIPGLIALGITSIFASGLLTWIVAILVALPFFLLVVSSPLSLFGGWVQIFTSSIWTLTYREMKTLESVAPAETPPVVK